MSSNEKGSIQSSDQSDQSSLATASTSTQGTATSAAEGSQDREHWKKYLEGKIMEAKEKNNAVLAQGLRENNEVAKAQLRKIEEKKETQRK